MGKNDKRMIFGIGFDLATGVDEVIKQWEDKESKRLQKVLDKKPLKISLEIKKNFITELRDFVRVTREVANAQRQINKAKKEELDIAAKAATVKTREANQRAANVRAAVQEATQQDQINKKKADAAYSEERLAQAKKNGIAATNAQNTAYKTQSTYLSRLLTRMAAYFSIHQAFSFLRQIREVTAEFELQRISLASLIQDAYKANVIFEQIKVQAVKSPYEIKDLVTYTKRLAAYGVEADDLMGTMNRLADISAGLGADMNRIILAYGQIQAAGVLKGTELRQLTELGIPMVDLLAQYYSTLRNEVVTTSEVFDMISKKEIPFKAVKDILEDLTSEGGRFFEMQSVQAETLAGQWSNMRDTLSIMFDEIGRTEEVRGMLEGMIDLVKHLALNWRDVWSVVKVLGFTYATLKGSAAIIRLLTIETIRQSSAKRGLILAERRYQAVSFKTNGFLKIRLALERAQAYLTRRVALATNFATASMWKLVRATLAFVATNPIGLIMGIAGAFGIYKLATSDGIDAMEAFRKRQEEMTKESVKNTATLVSNFKRLAAEAINSADGSERQNQALRRLKQQYGEIFPDWKLTVDYLRQMADGADNTADAFNSMAASIRSFSAEEMRQNLIENYQKQIEEQFSNTFAKLSDARGANFSKQIGNIMNRAFKEGMTQEALIDEVVDEFLTATGQSLDDFVKRLDIIDYEAGIGISEAKEIFKGWDLSEMISQLHELGERGQADALVMLLQLAEALRTSNGEIEKMMDSFDNLDPRLKEVNDQMDTLRKTLEAIEEETGGNTAGDVATTIDKKRKEAIDAATRKLIEGEGFTVESNVTLDWTIANLDEIKANAKKNGIELSDAFYSGLKSLRTFSGDYDDLWREDLANMVEYLDEGKRKVQAYSSDQIAGFGTLDNALVSVAEKYKDLGEEVARLKKTSDALKLKPIDEQDTKEIENYRKEISKIETIMQFLYNFLEKYGGLDLIKDDKKGRKVNPEIKQLEDELAMVEKIYKKYEEYRKTMGDAEAKALVEEYFKVVDLKWLKKAFSTTELKAQAQEALRIIKTFWGDTKKAQQNIQFKIGDIDYNETKRELEQEMKKLSADISRTKTAKEFFDRMLGMTGDKELSATLTMSVYGIEKPEGELSEFFAKQLAKDMQKQIQEYLPNIDISSAINEATSEIDPVKLKGIVDALDPLKVGQTNLDAVKKLIKEMIDGNANYLESLYDSYEKFLDYEHRKTIVAEREAKERKKIAEQNIPENEKNKLTEASEKRERAEKLKIDIEQFKAGEEYIKIFEEIENLSTMSIGRLMEALDKFMKDNAAVLAENPEQLKIFMDEYQKLYEGLITRNPFRAIVDGLKEYQSATKNVISARKELKKAEDSGDEAKKASAEAKLADALDKQQEALNKQVKGYQAASSALSNFGSIITDITEILGIAEDSKAGAFIKDLVKWLGIMATVLSTVAAILVVINTVGAPFLAIAAGIAAIAAGISYLANAKIRKANKEIDRQQKLLDNLAYSYDRLQKSAERAFGTEYIQNYQRQLANLEAQVEAYEKQLEAERSKGKKADKDKIKEYENQIRDAKDAIEDMYGSLSEHFLGTDLTSAARDFASAWIDAYKEFANTTDAMKAKFQDMIQNMIVESLIAKVMERALRPVFTMVDEMGDSDFYSNSFWSQLMTEMNKATENGVVGAQNIMGMLESIGINLRDTGTGLTGISRDIASASEESILGLAASINTQNFYISQVPTKLDTIIGLLRGGSAVVDSGVNVQDLITIQNQFLSHLPTIAQNTAETVARCERAAVACESMASKLGSVIKPKGTTSTHSVNVTIGS